MKVTGESTDRQAQWPFVDTSLLVSTCSSISRKFATGRRQACRAARAGRGRSDRSAFAAESRRLPQRRLARWVLAARHSTLRPHAKFEVQRPAPQMQGARVPSLASVCPQSRSGAVPGTRTHEGACVPAAHAEHMRRRMQSTCRVRTRV